MQPTTRLLGVLAAASVTTLAAGQPALAAQGAAANERVEPSPRELRLGDTVALRGRGIRTIRRHVAPGLRYIKIVDKKTPRRIFVLRADVADYRITFDVTLAGPTLGYRATVPEMARANRAIAAVNGDFSYRTIGRPIHAFAQDGTFVQSAGPGGASFAVAKTERRVFAGAPRQEMTATDAQTGVTWRIDRWNHGAPDIGEISAFTPAGGSLETPPTDSCSLHLTPSGAARPLRQAPGFEQRFSLDRHACKEDAVTVGDGMVLTTVAGTDEATELMSIGVGTTITVRWSLGWRNTYDVMGADRMLVRHGAVAVSPSCSTYLCQPQPRTALGATKDGTLLFVVVDGRQPGYSLSLSMIGLARLMRRLGAVTAVNLDGGGASTMVVNGQVVNRPSDGSLRHVTTAALILPGADRDEP